MGKTKNNYAFINSQKRINEPAVKYLEFVCDSRKNLEYKKRAS